MERFTPAHARKWESWVPEDTNEEVQNSGTDEIGDKERAEQEE